MTDKIKNAIELIYGKNPKFRWLKIIATWLAIGFTIFMIFNFNYDKKTGIDINAVDPAKLKGAK